MPPTERGPWNREEEYSHYFCCHRRCATCQPAFNRSQWVCVADKEFILLNYCLCRKQVEEKPLEANDELDETALGGIPSLDFRPVLELFAPTGNKFQMSPCGECGGTLEVGCWCDRRRSF